MAGTEFELVEISRIAVVGVPVILSRSQRENFSIISDLWKRFNAQIHKIGNRPRSGKDWEKFGITYTRDHRYCYLAAMRYMDGMRPPPNMVRKDIARGRYACISHSGKISDLKSTVRDIHKKILPENNLSRESPQKAGLIQFERYDKRFQWNKPDSIIEIYVPIETVTTRGTL
jgi:predicted transcriptional regulator YdeE